jgi:hypothetical protein
MQYKINRKVLSGSSPEQVQAFVKSEYDQSVMLHPVGYVPEPTRPQEPSAPAVSKGSFDIDDIHPDMSHADRMKARAAIADVLRTLDPNVKAGRRSR